MRCHQSNREIPPIIFIHYGNSPYLRYTLAQAVLNYPERPVWLIGDDTNSIYPFVHHVHHQRFSTTAFTFAKQYLHLNGNHPEFELFCFQRWFILRDFMVLNQLEKAVYLDSDILLYDNLQNDWELIGDTPLALYGVAPPAFINDVTMLDTFCRFMNQSYQRPENLTLLKVRYQQMLAAGVIGGICDMTFWEMLRAQLPEAVADLSILQPKTTCHDRNIELSEGFKTEAGIKKIHWHEGNPFGLFHENIAVRFKSLHMHGMGKELTKAFFQSALESLSTEADQTEFILDAVFFQYRITGIARVWEEILRQWARMPSAQNMLILDRDGTCPRIDGMRYRTVIRHDYNNLNADQSMLQQICDEEGARGFISTYYTTPLTTPSLLLIHDCIPEALGADLNEPAWQEKRHAVSYASCYCTVSDHSARDLRHYYPDTEKKPIQTIYNGVSEIFYPATDQETRTFREQFGIAKPYYLFVGPIEWYKNFALLIDGFKLLPNHSDYLIVRTRSGENEEVMIPEVITTGRLSDNQLRAAYSGALALVYPSWYEGFGLPVLEAMACGCPVIAAAASSIPEVAGNAACLIPPHNREAMAAALLSLQSPDIRQRLSQAGLAQAKQFSWRHTAETLLEAIHTIGAKP